MNTTPDRSIEKGILFEEDSSIEDVAEEIIDFIIETPEHELIAQGFNIRPKPMQDQINITVDKFLYQYPKDKTDLGNSMKIALSKLIYRYWEIHYLLKQEFAWELYTTSAYHRDENEYFAGIIRADNIVKAQDKVERITETQHWKTTWKINPLNPELGYVKSGNNLGHSKMYKTYPHLTLKALKNE